jgi:hypothetical protein
MRDRDGDGSQLKTHLRGPGAVLRYKSPDMVRQEIYGYLLTHAIAALICRAATEADIDPDRVKFLRTVRVIRRARRNSYKVKRPGDTGAGHVMTKDPGEGTRAGQA